MRKDARQLPFITLTDREIMECILLNLEILNQNIFMIACKTGLDSCSLADYPIGYKTMAERWDAE